MTVHRALFLLRRCAPVQVVDASRFQEMVKGADVRFIVSHVHGDCHPVKEHRKTREHMEIA